MSLLTIPLELREQIYEYHFEGIQPILSVDRRWKRWIGHKRQKDPSYLTKFSFESGKEVEVEVPLLKVCRKIQSELISFTAPNLPLRLTSKRTLAKVSCLSIAHMPRGYAAGVRALTWDPNEPYLRMAVAFFPGVQKCVVDDDAYPTRIGRLPMEVWRVEDLEQDSVKMDIHADLRQAMKRHCCDPNSLGPRQPVPLEYQKYYAPFQARFKFSTKEDQTYYVGGPALVRLPNPYSSSANRIQRAKAIGTSERDFEVEVIITEQIKAILSTPRERVVWWYPR